MTKSAKLIMVTMHILKTLNLSMFVIFPLSP
jgi:hypothetical protein